MVTGLYSCTKINEAVTPFEPGIDSKIHLTSKPYYGAISSDSDDSKTYLESGSIMHWSVGDKISLFRSSTNEQYLFNSPEDDIWSVFVKNDETEPTAPYSTTYALYPWMAETTSPSEGSICFRFPSSQEYAVGSFAIGANPMTAVAENAESDRLKFQNLCGFLQLRLYGEATVRRIRFYGNNDEVLCGDASVSLSYGEVPELVLAPEGGKDLTLDCGESGIVLGETAQSYTSFWFVIPPIVFTKGFTFEIEFLTGGTIIKSTSRSISISRAHAQPMAAFEVDPSPKKLTAFGLSDGVHTYQAYEIKNDIVSVQIPNTVDLSSLKAVFIHTGASIRVNGEEQESGVNVRDFRDFASPTEYVVTAPDGSTRTYTICVFNLPVVSVDTPNAQSITSKTTWIEGTTITIRETALDGTPSVTSYEAAQVKGRGNSSWQQAKKPYAIKLNKKAEVLGMPKHKRWCLLSNCWGYFFGNLTGYELGRRTEGMAWAPHGKYVELILNGEHKGCYLLTEQIKIDPNRLNITEIGSTDISGDALTGGYLLTYDNTWDEDYKFYSQYYNLPVMFKIPDEDIPDEQFNYVQDYINTFEASLKDVNRLQAREYLEYIDVDSFIDQYFVWEIAGKSESGSFTDFVAPRSVYYHKDRLGKLTAGPVWDFDSYLFMEKNLRCKSGQYYKTLFTEPYFVERVKEKWPRYRDRLDERGGMIAYVDSLYAAVRPAALRDRVLWPWASYVSSRSVDEQYTLIHDNMTAKLDWLGAQFAAMEVNYDNKSGGNEDFGGQQDKGDDFNYGF